MMYRGTPRPEYAITCILGTPEMVPLFLGNPLMSRQGAGFKVSPASENVCLGWGFRV